MNESILTAGLLAAGDSLRNVEFDWPATPGRWAITITAIVILVATAIGVYRLDLRGMSGGWRVLLTTLRLAVIAALVVIAVDPQEHIRQMAFRPSRVAILADTSLSMRFPETAVGNAASPAAQRNRAEAIRDTLGRFASVGRTAKAAQRADLYVRFGARQPAGRRLAGPGRTDGSRRTAPH